MKDKAMVLTFCIVVVLIMTTSAVQAHWTGASVPGWATDWGNSGILTTYLDIWGLYQMGIVDPDTLETRALCSISKPEFGSSGRFSPRETKFTLYEYFRGDYGNNIYVSNVGEHSFLGQWQSGNAYATTSWVDNETVLVGGGRVDSSYVNNYDGLYLWNVIDGTFQTLEETMLENDAHNSQYQEILWTDAGIWYVSNGSIWLRTVDGNKHKLIDQAGSTISIMKAASDGIYWAESWIDASMQYPRSYSNIYEYTIGATSTLYWSSIGGNPVLSPDNKWVALSTGEGGWDFWHITAVPEPNGLIPVLAGITILATRRRKKK